MTPIEITQIDYSDLEGGLRRMLDRFKESGTLTGEPDVDVYLRQDPNAALLGLLYDQRVRAEYAFSGPYRLRERLGHLEMKKIAAMDPEEFLGHFTRPPAIHRFSNKMAENTQTIARILSDQYDGNASNLWNDGADFAVVQSRIKKLPGFGEQKAAKMKYVLHYLGYRDFSDS
jgi:uncharacterized HhH-GPD family protein